MSEHDADRPARDGAFAHSPRRPLRPHGAAILTSQRTTGDGNCDTAAARAAELGVQQPGRLHVGSARDLGTRVSDWDSEDAIAGWRREIEHTATRERGRNDGYGHYALRAAKVEHAYTKKHAA